MRPRYSMLTLLLAIGYVALMITAVQKPESVWRLAASVALLLVTALAAAYAFHPQDVFKRTFGRVMLVCFGFYYYLDSQTSQYDYLPHQAIARYYLMQDVPEGYVLGLDGSLIYAPGRLLGSNGASFGLYKAEPFVAMFSGQLFGLFCGVAASWSFGRQARQREARLNASDLHPLEK